MDLAEDGVNKLNALLARADDHNLYIGVSGVFNGARSGANLDGVVVFIDTDFGTKSGVNDFDSINDDSGPAALISNSQIQGPPSFGAELAVAAFRTGGINNAPTAPFVADFALTPNGPPSTWSPTSIEPFASRRRRLTEAFRNW